MKTAFGLDLGGYSTGRSALARASLGPSGDAEVTVYRGHAFAKTVNKSRTFEILAEQELELLIACLEKAPLYMNVPIDLQRLPCPGDETFAWQLVQRPVARVFGGLPPLADRIGAVVARFSNLLRAYRLEHPEPLGQRLYETYPAGSLRLLAFPHEGHKAKSNRIAFGDGRWAGRGTKGEQLAKIAGLLKLTAPKESELDHDEIDAVICALTSVLDEACLFGTIDFATPFRT